ncbi:hypothetical protein NUSPORA_00040 [Nucleospora cyclopteri]
MLNEKSLIKAKIELLDELITKMENKENLDITDVLKREIMELKAMNEGYVTGKNAKLVINSERGKNKTRFFLKDGSTYVVTNKGINDYKYLFDATTKTITYEFGNGQIERTFKNGLKEIRMPDGRIYIKHGTLEYDHINK